MSVVPVLEIVETLVEKVVGGGPEHQDHVSGVMTIRQATVELEEQRYAVSGKGC